MPYQVNHVSDKVGFGLSFIDKFFSGGLNRGVINIFYGPPGVGKTTFSYHFLSNVLSREKGQVAFFDNDHGFNPSRFLQISRNKSFLDRIIIFKPNSPEEFELQLNSLKKFKFNAIVVDSIASLYRVEFYDKKTKIIVGKMSKALTTLRNYVEKNNAACFVTNQVYAKFENHFNKNQDANFDPVGGIMLRYLAFSLVELSFVENHRQIQIVKHSSLPKQKYLYDIDEYGIKPVYVKNET